MRVRDTRDTGLLRLRCGSWSRSVRNVALHESPLVFGGRKQVWTRPVRGRRPDLYPVYMSLPRWPYTRTGVRVPQDTPLSNSDEDRDECGAVHVQRKTEVNSGPARAPQRLQRTPRPESSAFVCRVARSVLHTWVQSTLLPMKFVCSMRQNKTRVSLNEIHKDLYRKPSNTKKSLY